MYLNVRDIKQTLDMYYPMRDFFNVALIGAPGIGKTQSIQEFAEEKGVKCVTFILSNTVPSEVSGMRMPDNRKKKMAVFDDERLASLEDGDVLFFDEMLEAHPQVQQACLTLINDKVLASGKKLPSIMIVAASNEVTSPASIRPSFRNRFIWYDIQFDHKEWSRYIWDKYGLYVDSTIAKRIENDGSGYNIFTPRTAERFIKLWVNGRDNPEVSRHIAGLFGSINIAGFNEMQKLNDKELNILVAHALREANIGIDTFDIAEHAIGWKDKMDELIESHPEIITILEGVEVHEDA
jgi:Holliday junction resolvasome RuvABC ATP-dependent DNA helicase subunit